MRSLSQLQQGLQAAIWDGTSVAAPVTFRTLQDMTHTSPVTNRPTRLLCAGMRPVTIILKKTQDKARLLWPEGSPPAYQVGAACSFLLPAPAPALLLSV